MLRTLGDVVRRTAPALTASEDATVSEIAQLLSAHRADAMAVVDQCNLLVGIVTAKDVAKCIARGWSPNEPVSRIMTPHPQSLKPQDAPAKAVKIMKGGGFRHCPIVESDGAVLGVVDCLMLSYDAIVRLQKLYSAVPTKRTFRLFREAREVIEKRTLRQVVGGTEFVSATADVSVRQACEVLTLHRASALVVVDDNGKLEGMFSCTDVMNRIVARGLDPDESILEDVMTKSPEAASPDITILDALQRMQACGFRHLPVVEVEEETEKVVALVDILQLASDALLRNMSPKESDNINESSGFFGGLLYSLFGENAATLPDKAGSVSSLPSRLATGPSAYRRSSMELGTHRRSRVVRHVSSSLSDQGVIQAIENAQMLEQEMSARAAPDTTEVATFKFKDFNGEYRRVKFQMANVQGAFDRLIIDLRRRFSGPPGSSMKVKYVDEDGDEVLLSNDEDLFECFAQIRDNSWKTVKLMLTAIELEAESPIPSRTPLGISSEPSFVSSQLFSGTNSPTRLSRQVSPTRSIDSPTKEFSPKAKSKSVSPTTENSPAKERDSEGEGSDGADRSAASIRKASEAHDKMVEGDAEGAILRFGEAIRLDQTNTRAYIERGAAHLISGKSGAAEEDYRAAIALVRSSNMRSKDADKTHDACLIGLAEVLIDQRRYEEAADRLLSVKNKAGREAGSSAFLDDLSATTQAANEATEAKEWGSALSLFNNALRVERAYLSLKPSEKPAASLRLGRAKCYVNLNDWDMALEDYDAAIELDEESNTAFKGRGHCLLEMDKKEDALQALERALKLDPADPAAMEQVDMLKASILPKPQEEMKKDIAKLGGMLSNMNIPKKSRRKRGRSKK